MNPKRSALILATAITVVLAACGGRALSYTDRAAIDARVEAYVKANNTDICGPMPFANGKEVSGAYGKRQDWITTTDNSVADGIGAATSAERKEVSHKLALMFVLSTTCD